MKDASTATKTIKTTSTATKVVTETNATTTVVNEAFETQDSNTPKSSEHSLKYNPGEPKVEDDIFKAYRVRTFYLIIHLNLNNCLRDWPVMMCDPSPGNFLAHFLFNSKIKTTYPGVLPPISSFAPRPKLGLWWSK